MEVKQSVPEAAIKAPVAATPVSSGPTIVQAEASRAGAAAKQRSRGRSQTNGTAGSAEHVAGQPSQAAPALGSGSLPERWLVDGLRLVKGQARRRDLVGQAAYRYLVVVHGGLEMAVRTLTRIERASEPPARIASRPTRPAARRAAPVRRTGRRATARLRRAG